MILRDPVHGLVSFETDDQSIVPALLGTAEVQRLRRIKQLGLTSLAYPGADHTRFSHAIGTAHVMTRLIARIQSTQSSEVSSGASPGGQGPLGQGPLGQGPSEHYRMESTHVQEALAAALLHDVGHGPFSHLFEAAFPRGLRHEEWSSRIVLDPSTEVHRVLSSFGKHLPERVEALIHGRHELTYLARAVSGTFDVDRCDYLLRDAYFTGVSYGRFDLDWLLRSFRLSSPSSGPPALAIDGTKGLPAIESFVLARLFMFQQVYFHKASRASEFLLSRILRRMGHLILDGSKADRAVSDRVPAAIAEVARRGDTSLEHYLELDDVSMWTTLTSCREARDPVLRDLVGRLLSRRLFKSIELYGDDASPEGRTRILGAAEEVARSAGLDPTHYVGLDDPPFAPFDPQADPITIVFPDGTEKKPAEVSFLLGRLHGEVSSRPRVIFPEELRPALLAELGHS